MKKLSLFILSLLCLSFYSCDWFKTGGGEGTDSIDSTRTPDTFNIIPVDLPKFQEVTGTVGDGTSMNYIELITEKGDTLSLRTSGAHFIGDLYATQKKAYVNNQGMETWSIMDYGLYNRNGFAPCPYTAWEQEVMGWTEIEDVGSKMADGRCQLSDVLPLIEGGKAYKLQNPDNDRNYIVLENVQKRGLNQYASGHGLLVFQVDYPYSSVQMSDTPNNNPGHPSVAVVPAGGELIIAYLRGKDKTYTVAQWQESLAASVFPGTKGVTSLTDNMQLPNYCFYVDKTAQPTNFMLSSISEDTETGAVSFLVAKDDQTSIGDVRWKMEDGRSDVWYDLSGRAFNTQHSEGHLHRQWPQGCD